MTDLVQLQAALGPAYTIQRELGGGGMSRVFVARENALDRLVVIKVLPRDLGGGVSIERFRREIQLVASLQHPHIVPLLTAGTATREAAGTREAGVLLYYTMPLVEGESLRARISREGRLPIGEAIRLLRDVVDALACAHEHGIVHRDIKPDNVLVSRHHGLVTDFGVAKALTEATSSSEAWMTTAGLALGTPAYMAPEQVTADPNLDHRVDIYAVGALAYEMLTGQPPFTGSSAQAVLAAHITRTPEPLERARREVPAALSMVVMRCLEKLPEDRWQTAAQLLEQVDSISSPAAPRHPITAMALFAAASILILAATRALTDRLGLPDWVFVAAALLLVAGLPVILRTALTHWRRPYQRWLSWRKAIGGGVAAFAGLGLLTAGYMGMRALGIGPVGSLVASGVLKERERIIVADFVNRTGDPLLADALTQAFRVDFAQSPTVTSVEPEYVRQVLGRMAKPDSSRLDAELAREVAVREGIKAVVAGEINRAGPQFIVSARLLTADSGTVLATYRETADDSTEVIHAVDRLSRRLRERIGESLRTVRRSPPLERVTTASLEALRKYSQGIRAADAGDGARGAALLEEAIALDSGFAMAHRKIGIVLGNYDERRDRQIQALSKAFQYRDRLTPRERYLAASSYHAFVTGEHDKAREDLRSLLELFPRDASGLNNLAVEYNRIRDHAEAAELFSRTIAADSGNIVFFTNLSDALFAQGLADSAKAILRRAGGIFPGNPLGTWYDAMLFSSLGAYDSAVARLRPLAEQRQADPSWRSIANEQLANVAAVRGQLAEAARRARAGMAVDEERGAISSFLGGAAQQGLRAVALGQARGAVQGVETALRRHQLTAIDPTDRPYLGLVRFYALAGEPARAKSLLAEYERSVAAPLRRDDEPDRHIARGLIALAEHDSHGALEEFRAGDQGACVICPLPGLGQAYDLEKQPDSALAVYQRYVTTPAMFRIFQDALWLPGIYFRLGELYEARGDRAEAAEYYGRFAELWKNADPALQPRVAEAKRRLAAVTAEPRP